MTSPRKPRKGAIVTGGASGIGRAVVRMLRAEGWEVCSVDLRAPADVRGDVRDSETASRAVSFLRAPLGVLVNCAGIAGGGSVERLSREEWDRVLGVDLTGVFVFTQAAAREMIPRKWGRIVNVASTLALRARRGTSVYAAAKAGVAGLTRASARDLGRHGITVNAVAPGLVETRLAREIPAEAREKLLQETALGRFAQPDDVAGVIVFLCSDRARHITGEIIRIDGGQLA